MKKILKIIISIILIIIILILIFIRNNFNMSNVSLSKKTVDAYNYKEINLNKKEKDKLISYLRYQSVKERKDICDCILFGEYKIVFGNYELIFDKNENFGLIRNIDVLTVAPTKSKQVNLSSRLKQYVINLIEEKEN